MREFLKNNGAERLQYSVYELKTSMNHLDKIRSSLLKFLNEGKGTIHILKPCKKCYSNIIQISTEIKQEKEQDIF